MQKARRTLKRPSNYARPYWSSLLSNEYISEFTLSSVKSKY
ncbi:hypothetical protein [Clostridium algoriphilum]|nr:hypothetical protein [Clostridium algoriphilum]